MIRYSYRVGRKLGRTIYRMLGNVPSDADKFVGIMDSAADAEHIVHLLNMEAAFRNGDPHAEPQRDSRTLGERLRAGETVSHDDMRRADL